jgi:hypothetical protein
MGMSGMNEWLAVVVAFDVAVAIVVVAVVEI